MTSDDWGSPLGSDPDRKERPVPKKGSRLALLRLFTDSVPPIYFSRMNSAVNGKAMMVAFSTLTAHGYTDEEIREIIALYMQQITRRPLPESVAPWRGFIANLDQLGEQVKRNRRVTVSEEDLTETVIDKRLLGE